MTRLTPPMVYDTSLSLLGRTHPAPPAPAVI
jgi:hypothetical protein